MTRFLTWLFTDRFWAALRQRIAKRRLQRIVEANRNSFRTQLYAKNRAAQLKRRCA